ncbi:MAG TPA: CbiX/SirB N-terminal domain-containing protein [Burkholderiales bacterium]|nr:CbiX/SirB N-terminal domain-containing protein [Burkholderiales bacterium]
MTDALILFAHGARDPGWSRPFQRIREQVLAAAPGIRVELAFLEHTRPSLEEAVAVLSSHGIMRATLVPLFLGQGGHLKQDLPALVARVRERFPSVVLRTTPAIGESQQLTAMIAAWALEQHRLPG